MKPVDVFLPRLDGLRQVGPGRWRARCPNHESRSLSLAVRVLHDGVLLVRCFAGCTAAEIATSVGLYLSSLFPDSREVRPSYWHEGRPRSVADLKRLIREEASRIADAEVLA